MKVRTLKHECVVIILLLGIFLSPIMAMSALGHNEDIGYVVYGYVNWSTFKKNGTEDERHSYYIVSDAAAFAIDEQGMGNNLDKYNELKMNLEKTGQTVSLPQYYEFPSLGGGIHRAYNHQGFYYEYIERTEVRDSVGFNKYLERWEMGRDRILIPAVAVAFGIDQSDPRAEALALLVYYSHIIGDLREGSVASVAQMGRLANNYTLLQEFESELGRSLEKCGGRALSYFRNLQAAGEFKKVRKNVQSITDKYSEYLAIKSFFRTQVAPIVELLIGSSIRSLKIIKRG